MFPNMDPKMLKKAMDQLGIKSKSIESVQVVIRCNDKDIVIDEPEVTLVEGQGVQSFQISGRISEIDKSKVEISEDDVRFVQEQSGVSDEALVRRTLEEKRGDIAGAILKLKQQKEQQA